MSSPFKAVPAKIDLPSMERGIIAWWKSNRTFAKTLERNTNGQQWVFYEGPPTANGTPGTHHVEARAFKDVFPRYKTMKGFSVPRRAGWDCHGLPVELAVEKEFGISGKPDIERLGIDVFNGRCRESVQRNVDQFEAMTDRMGYWVDMDHPYRTMSPEYIDSVWWALKQIFNKGLLSEDYRVAPYCTRCGTTLSDHEVAQGYETVTDPSVYVRFPVRGQIAGYDDVDLLIWTTTPWTLVSNTAIAVHPDVKYVVARTDAGNFVVAEPLLTSVLGEDAAILATLPGKELAGQRYERPFDMIDIPDAHMVVLADYVTTTDGTGLVHQAPAFGVDDLTVCRANGLPVINPIGPDGAFLQDVPRVGGLFFKDADTTLIEDLAANGRLFLRREYEHPYPHCWRCHTPLMYYAQLSWYIRTTQIRDRLRAENKSTNWYPEHIKTGRFGGWLDNNIDWALSRSRYWGTPLPLWRTASGRIIAVGSRAELAELSGRDLSNLDPHRPFIDDVTIIDPESGEVAHRVPEVIDAWFDSGAMPFAQLGYPHVPGSVEAFEKTFPADYICEAIDQTRGWFYTLMAVGTLVFDRSPYENVMCLGHILAEDGRKMSKHLGNVLLPIPLMDTHGADALRWFMLCSGSPWSPRRVGGATLDEIARKFLMTFWNTATFFSLYASLSDWKPDTAAPVAQRPVLDRWALSGVHQLARSVDHSLENFDTAGAGRAISQYVDSLSNWYVRRSRSRFWAGDQNALATLYECLNVLTRVAAPFVPFITEQIWREIIRLGDGAAPESVHLATWPEADDFLIDNSLLAAVEIARTVTEAGRAARKRSGIKTRQPLGRALVSLPVGVTLSPELVEEISDELNVRSLEPFSASDTVVDFAVKANFRSLGRRYAKRTPEIVAAINASRPATIAQSLRETGEASIDFEGSSVVITADDVTVSEVPRTGWAVDSVRDVTIALDTEITAELKLAGIARDVIRFVQDARKRSGLDLADRIDVRWVAADDELREAINGHFEEIRGAVLATHFAEDPGVIGFAEHRDAELGLAAAIRTIEVSSTTAVDRDLDLDLR